MKSLFALLAAAGLAGLALGQPLTPQPSPELKKLDRWIGDWTYETVIQPTALGPGGTFIGSASTQPILGGMFVEMKGDATGPNGSGQFTVTQTYDPFKRQYSWRFLNSGGGINDSTFTIDGAKIAHTGTWIADGKTYQIRGTYEFASDLGSYTETREISADGKVWLPFWTSRATKMKAALAMPVSENVEQQLMDLERTWARSIVNADVATLNRFIAPEWILTGDDGQLQTKPEELEDMRTGNYAATECAVDDMKVRIYGDTAVVTGRTIEKSTYKGRDSSGVYRWTDTWVKSDDGWQCVSTHNSKVAEK